MAVRNDLIPLPVIKQWSKRLVKAWPEVSGADAPKLSVCQEAIARVLGHSNWKILLQDYAPTPEAPTSKNPDSAMDVANNLFEHAMDKQYSSIVWKVGHEQAVILGKHHDQETEMMTMPRDRAIEILKVLYNVLSENADVSFREDYSQNAYLKMTLCGKKMMLFFRSLPLTNKFFQAEIQFSSADWTATPAMRLGSISPFQNGISVLAAPTEELRRDLVSMVVTGLAQQHHVLVVTDKPQPRVEENPNVTVAPVIKQAYEHSLGEGLQRTLRYSQFLGHHILVVDCRNIHQAWEVMMENRHKGIHCLVVMDAWDVMDGLVQLDQQKQLNPLLRYGILQTVVTVQKYEQLIDITPQILSLDDRRCSDLLGSSPSSWPLMLKGWRTK